MTHRPMCIRTLFPAQIAAFVACVFAVACRGSIDPGPRVQLVLAETATGEASDDALRIEEAWLTTWSVELAACGASANKHGLASPNRAVRVVVEDVADGFPFGPSEEMTPIPGEYCGVIVEALPADEDATGDSVEAQRGLTLRALGSRDDEPFAVETAAAFSHQVDFDEPTQLGVGDRWTLTLTRDPSAWLQSEDFDWSDPEAVARAALQDALWTATVTLVESDIR